MTVDIDEAKVEKSGPGLWFGWTTATMLGMLLGFLPFLPIIDDIDIAWIRLLIPLWAGFLVGMFQWLVLRRYMTHCADWILHGGAGWAFGYAIGLLIIQALSGSIIGVLMGYVIFGVIIALVQWPVLRREIPNVLPWVAASVVGWALGAFLGQATLNLLFSGQMVTQAASTAVISSVTGLVAGAITGLALVWIVRQPEHI